MEELVETIKNVTVIVGAVTAICALISVALTMVDGLKCLMRSQMLQTYYHNKDKFQSTLPVRGATAKIHKKGYVFSAKNIIFTADSCFRMIQLNENVRYLTQSAVKIGANLLENSVCFRFAD